MCCGRTGRITLSCSLHSLDSFVLLLTIAIGVCGGCVMCGDLCVGVRDVWCVVTIGVGDVWCVVTIGVGGGGVCGVW